MAPRVGQVIANGGIMVNDHDMPPEHARFFGYPLLWGSKAAAVIDTAGSGWALLYIAWFLMPGVQKIGWANAIIFIFTFFLAILIYLMGQTAVFMASGHAETRATSMSDQGTHGIMAKQSTNRGTLLFFRKYRVAISTGSMIYMFCTDLYGIFAFAWPWLWVSKDIGDSLIRFVVGLVAFGAVAAFFFLVALNGPLYARQMLHYAKEEDRRIEDAWKTGSRTTGGNGQKSLLVPTQPQQQPPSRQVASPRQGQQMLPSPQRQGIPEQRAGMNGGQRGQQSRPTQHAQRLAPRQQRTDEMDTLALAQQGYTRGRGNSYDDEEDE